MKRNAKKLHKDLLSYLDCDGDVWYKVWDGAASLFTTAEATTAYIYGHCRGLLLTYSETMCDGEGWDLSDEERHEVEHNATLEFMKSKGITAELPFIY